MVIHVSRQAACQKPDKDSRGLVHSLEGHTERLDMCAGVHLVTTQGPVRRWGLAAALGDVKAGTRRWHCGRRERIRSERSETLQMEERAAARQRTNHAATCTWKSHLGGLRCGIGCEDFGRAEGKGRKRK
eukprot:2300296-Amphidinium_carterae.1